MGFFRLISPMHHLSSTLLFLVAMSTTLPTSCAYISDAHIFSIDDVIGDFQGNTFFNNPKILCGVTGVNGSPTCPNDGPSPFVDDGVTLYPIDSEFGFHVADFLGASQKERDDGVWGEGFAGNVMDGPTIVGLAVSNAATDTYRAPARYGTWCQGLGGTAVKCSTEHYSVMEHVLTCHESIPYFYANPLTGEQAELTSPNFPDIVDCADQQLDNEALVVVDGVEGGGTSPPSELNYLDPFLSMEANDNTELRNNIAVTEDFSVTLKDDGKLLYRWGNLIKRPNDVRLYARLPLPIEWKERDEAGDLVNNFVVEKAYLEINHWITNNPNDQLRAEDLENEGARGRKPNYQVDGDSWLTIDTCYEGDGDLIDGTIGGTGIPVGTVLKNGYIDVPQPDGAAPEFQSADLLGGFTNAWYTTINRDPFEWSYLKNNTDDPDVFEFVGESGPLNDEDVANRELTLESGPRWRLKANKFGQDLPSLEIPRNECSQPPFQRDNIKYEVGEPTTTIINLLDWEDETDSPLATSRGWVDYTFNAPIFDGGDGVTEVSPGKFVSTNGLPMTEDFDLAVYIKGDKKPTRIFDARLFIQYEGEVEPALEQYNIRWLEISVVPATPSFGNSFTVYYYVVNVGPSDSAETGSYVTLTYRDNKGNEETSGRIDLPSIPEGEVFSGSWGLTAPSPSNSGTIKATIIGQIRQAYDDLDPGDDRTTFDFVIKK